MGIHVDIDDIIDIDVDGAHGNALNSMKIFEFQTSSIKEEVTP